MCVSYEEEDTCVCHMRRRIHTRQPTTRRVSEVLVYVSGTEYLPQMCTQCVPNVYLMFVCTYQVQSTSL